MKLRNLAEKLRGLSRKKKIGLVCLMVCLVVLYHCPVYRSNVVIHDKYFEPYDELLLYFRGTPLDQWSAQAILDQGRAAFEDRETSCDIYGPDDPRREKHGALWRHVTGPEAAEMQYSIELLSAHLGLFQGKVWVRYSHQIKDEHGNFIRQTAVDEPELWIVRRFLGKWHVVEAVWEA